MATSATLPPRPSRGPRPAAAARVEGAHGLLALRQRHHRRASPRRLLCRRHRRHLDLVRHARYRQHRASGLHHRRLLRRLYRQHAARRRPDHRQHRGAAAVLRPRRAGLSGLLRRLRKARPGKPARPRLLLRHSVHHRSRAGAGVRRRLPLCQRHLYRPQPASRRPGIPLPAAGAGADRHRDVPGASNLSRAHLHRPRRDGGVAGPAGAAADGHRPDPHQAHRLRNLDRHRVDGGRLSDHHPAGHSLGRARLYRPRVRHLRARGPRQPARHAHRRAAARRAREPDRHLLRAVLGAGGVVRHPAA